MIFMLAFLFGPTDDTTTYTPVGKGNVAAYTTDPETGDVMTANKEAPIGIRGQMQQVSDTAQTQTTTQAQLQSQTSPVGSDKNNGVFMTFLAILMTGGVLMYIVRGGKPFIMHHPWQTF